MCYISPETQNANLHRETTVCSVDLPTEGPWSDGAGLTGAPRGSLGLDTGAELGRRATAGENWGQDQTLHKLPGHPGI